MKTFDYKPQNESFEGIVKVDLPTYKERIDLVKQIGTDITEANAINKAGDILKLVEKHVVSVDLTHANGAKFKSLDDLGYYKEGSEIVNELGMVVLNGIPLGNA